MTEKIVNINSLQAYLSKIILAEKVKVTEIDNVITLEAVNDESAECPLFGAAVGSKLTVEKFLAMSREDKELES